jgi:3-hydroxybutyryl-CoA dehydrogenase
MKIAVIAGEVPFKQWISDKLPLGWECLEMDEVGELENHRDAGLIVDLSFVPDEDRIGRLSGMLPVPVMINSVVYTCEELGHPFIRINAWPGMVEREVHEIALGADDKNRLFVEELYANLGWKYRIVADVPGMISGRILAMIINEAYFTLQEHVSTKEEIDIAMKLGTNYPMGPFEWSEKIGLKNIYDLLNKLGATDERYMAAKGMIAEMRNSPGAASVAHSD